MKYRVNLLKPENKPKYHLLSLPFSALVWTLCIVLITSLTNSAEQDLQNQRNQAQQILTSFQQQESLLATLRSEQKQRTRDPVLERQLQLLQRRLSQRQEIMRQLAQQQRLTTQGFAPLLLAFSESHHQGVWLTRIRQIEQQLILEGGVADSVVMADWLVGLKGNNHFVGRTFDDARLYRDEKDQLKFSVGALPVDYGSEPVPTDLLPAEVNGG